MFATGAWVSWGLAISLTVMAFPHMLVRIFAAADVIALRNTCRLYPAALILLWLPVVVMGVWEAVAVPGLQGRTSDGIFVRLVQEAFGPWLEGLCLAGVLAAVMPRCSPVTSCSDCVRTCRTFNRCARAGCSWSRWRSSPLLVVARPASIFAIASFSFSGYVMLVPPLCLGVRGRRFTAVGAMTSIGLGNAVLLLMCGDWRGMAGQPVGTGCA